MIKDFAGKKSDRTIDGMTYKTYLSSRPQSMTEANETRDCTSQRCIIEINNTKLKDMKLLKTMWSHSKIQSQVRFSLYFYRLDLSHLSVLRWLCKSCLCHSQLQVSCRHRPFKANWHVSDQCKTQFAKSTLLQKFHSKTRKRIWQFSENTLRFNLGFSQESSLEVGSSG